MPTRPRLTSTHTVSTLELSPSAYEEIAGKLRAADYAHVFEDDQPGSMMDMTGIGLTRAVTLICKSCVQEYEIDKPHECPGIAAIDHARTLAAWLEGMHDYARGEDQKYLARAAHALRQVDEISKRLSYVMNEKKARGNYAVTVGFLDLESAQQFHQWIAEQSSKATKAGT